MPLACTRTLLIVVGFAVICLTTIGAFTMLEGRHDPDWWKHSHSSKLSGIVGKTIIAPPEPLHPLRNRADGKANGAGGGDDSRPLNGRGAESRKLIDLSAIKQGEHYLADYDVSKVKPPVNLPVGHPRRKFDFIDITSPNAEWIGVWLSNSPNVAAIPEFLTDAECDELIAEAKKHMFRSQVAPYKNSKESPVSEIRTSSQAWLNPDAEGSIAKKVVDRMMRVLKQFDPHAHEELQLLQYERGQFYAHHADYFDPKFYGAQASNRAVTFYCYLSDVAQGGETCFPRAGGRPPPLEYRSCDKGLRVRPHRRMCAIFYDMKPTGELDDTSLHGSCPVLGKNDVKYGSTLWIRR